MIESSLHAAICDLLGDDPDAEPTYRPTVRQALARVGRSGRIRREPEASEADASGRRGATIDRGQVIAARQGRRRMCVVVTGDGRPFVVPDHCPHDGGLLSDGYVEGNRLVCARHGWEFDLVTGRCPMRPGACLERVDLARFTSSSSDARFTESDH